MDLVGYCRGKLMVRYMVTKWGERVESKREGQLVCNSSSVTSLTYLTTSFRLKGQIVVLQGEATLTSE